MLLKGLTVKKEDESVLLNLSDEKKENILFLLVVDPSKEDAVAYCHQIERCLSKVQLKFEEITFDSSFDMSVFKKKALDSQSSVILARPLPQDFFNEIISILPPENDPDCLGIQNEGKIYKGEGLLPATAQSVIRLLDFYKIAIQGKRAVIVGRSISVGLPIAMSLMRKNAFVSIAHSKISPEAINRAVSESDIVILASGKKGLVPKDAFRQGQVVIDCGYHAEDNSGDLGFVPDENFFLAYTPVPGGVGPLTISTLIMNALVQKGLIE